MLVRNGNPIRVAQQRCDIEMVVARELMPCAEECTGSCEPRVGEQAESACFDAESGVAEERHHGHANTLGHGADRNIARDA